MQDAATAMENPVHTGLPAILRRIGRNAGITIGAGGMAVALGLIALALNARALGTAGLGALAVIIAAATLLDRMFALLTWQPMIKLGSDALAVGDQTFARQLIGTTLLFDLCTAIAASLAGVGLVLMAGGWIGIPDEYAPLAAIYMASLATRVVDAPTGMLRLHNRFGLLAAVQLVPAVLGCLLAIVFFVSAAPFGAYVLGLAAAAVVGNLLLLATALVVVRQAGVPPSRPSRRALRAVWSFSWAAGLSGTINSVRHQGIIVIMGSILDPAAVGIYYVAERLAGVLGLIMVPTHQAVFPEASKLVAANRFGDLRRLVLFAGAGCGVIGLTGILAFIPFGSWIITVVSGPAYVAGYWPVVILAAGHLMTMAGVGVRAAVITGVGPKAMLAANIIGLTGIALAPILISQMGLIGGAASSLLFDALWLVAATVIYARFLPTRPQSCSAEI